MKLIHEETHSAFTLHLPPKMSKNKRINESNPKSKSLVYLLTDSAHCRHHGRGSQLSSEIWNVAIHFMIVSSDRCLIAWLYHGWLWKRGKAKLFREAPYTPSDWSKIPQALLKICIRKSFGNVLEVRGDPSKWVCTCQICTGPMFWSANSNPVTNAASTINLWTSPDWNK